SWAQIKDSHSGWRATTPMLDMSPLSPLRAHASRINGTSAWGSPGAVHATGSGSGAGGAQRVPAGISTGSDSPSRDTFTLTSALSRANENGLIMGEGEERPAPGPVVPGDQDVPDGAISRAKISSGWRSRW